MSWKKAGMTDSNSDYLYGDSTPAPLRTDFIAYLRDLVDFAVQVLLWEGQAAEAARNAAMLQEGTERGIVSVESMAADVAGVLDLSERGGLDPFVARCSAKIRSAAWEAVRGEAAAVRAAAEAEVSRAVEAATNARTDCERALEALLLRQDVPDAVVVTKLSADSGIRYDARLMAQTPFGLSWEVALEIPAAHSLDRVVRMDRIVERLEVQVPEESGWPQKPAKIRPLRVDRLYLTELVSAPVEAFMKLRATPEGAGAGCNLWIHRDSMAVRLERVHANGLALDAPCDIEGADAEALHLLHETVRAWAGEIAHNRRAPVAAKINDAPVHQHEVCAVVERLIASVAPRVDEIARRSLSPGELVLRRRLGDNHREEIFLSKAELLKAIEPLPPALRGAFAPLNLGQTAELPADTERAPGVTNGNGHVAFDGAALEEVSYSLEPTVIVDDLPGESSAVAAAPR
jgi:hypothetical protein